MHKTRVEISPAVRVGTVGHMPEGIHPVRMIQVSVKTEDLTETGFTVPEEGLRKPSLFTHPIMTRKGRQGGTQRGWTHGDWGIGTRGIEPPRGECCRISRGGISRKGFWVVDLTDNPSLDECDVLTRRDFDR